MKTEIASAKRKLEQYLESKWPDYFSLSEEQAKDLFAISSFRVWQAWRILDNVMGNER